MRKLCLLFLTSLPSIVFSQHITTRFEQSGGAESPAYSEIIQWWKKLDAFSPIVKMMEMGPTDAGLPLHLVMVSADKDFDMRSIKAKKKAIIFINNGIHPGEPDGIDASMLLVRDIVEYYNQEERVKKSVGRVAVNNRLFGLPSNVVLAIIPVYNIGGCLNRSANYRIDQNGPKEKGFRGNSQNLDLNRDFIKCDSKEALTFTKIFHYLDPDVFVDNHVSDGADYQHVMTLLTSQYNKLGGKMGEYLNQKFESALYSLMKGKGYDLVPYVNHFGETPEKGWSAYWDSPRYSSGYTTLWNTFSFTPETHMLKPYKQRVESTKALEESFIEFTSQHCKEMLDLRVETKKAQLTQNTFPLAWKLDRSQSTQITYKGFEAGHKPSEVSGQSRLYYDRSKPFETKVPFYNYYRDTLSAEKPKAYIIPRGWWKVIERLQANNVQMRRLTRDTAIEVQWYKIENYQTSPRPYEGHHPNSQVKILANTKTMTFQKGDWYIPMNQIANRFLIETLEPQGEDSYFAWNFFDPILGQKEGYSDYAFEDIAAEYLKNNPGLKAKLDQRKTSDSTFAKNGRAQLDFVFQNSPYFEPAYLQYPIYKVMR
jgi:hypothetical protein